METENMSDLKIPFGKYRGHKLAHVAISDPSYVTYLAGIADPRPNGVAVVEAAKALVASGQVVVQPSFDGVAPSNPADVVLAFGKYRNYRLGELAARDPSYIVYLSNMTDAKGANSALAIAASKKLVAEKAIPELVDYLADREETNKFSSIIKQNSDYQGQVGDRFEREVKVVFVRHMGYASYGYHGHHGAAKYLVVAVDKQGNKYNTFTSSEWVQEDGVEVGDILKITGTVTRHEEEKYGALAGAKTTVLNRVKAVFIKKVNVEQEAEVA